MVHGKLSCSDKPLCRTPSKRQVVKVTRCLFGPVDHVETRRLLEEDTTLMSSEKRRQWSFDFEIGRPTSPCSNDRYLWEPFTGSDIKMETTEQSREPIKSEYRTDACVVNELTTTHLDILCSATFDHSTADRRTSKHNIRRVSKRNTNIPG